MNGVTTLLIVAAVMSGVLIAISGLAYSRFEMTVEIPVNSTADVYLPITNVDIAYPWLCDTNSNEIGRLTSSLRATNHSDHRELYIDTVSLASLIPSNVDVKIMAGMADDTSLPTGVLALYNVLSCNKEITMKQGRTHTYEPNNAETYVITNK